MPERKVVVFLGPSLERAAAQNILDAVYRPPAARGDIFMAVREKAEIIGLIDGVFYQACAIAHREILYALEEGVKVIGASSMGALRASELDSYGMVGVGKVYELYKSGELVSDDEVALIFEPESFTALSEPLVNIRHNLDIAEEKDFISKDDKEKLLGVAQSLYYPERQYEKILAIVEQDLNVDVATLRRFLSEEKRDLKREDAIAALEWIKRTLDKND